MTTSIFDDPKQTEHALAAGNDIRHTDLSTLIRPLSVFLLIIIIALITGCSQQPKVLAPEDDRTIVLTTPLWDYSGKYILTSRSGIDSIQQLLCINVASKRAVVIAGEEYYQTIDAWAWASHRAELCYISNSSKAIRTLHIADVAGRQLREVELLQDFSTWGLEWTREGSIVVIETKYDPSDKKDPQGLTPSVIRVFSEKLEKKREFDLPFTIYSEQVHPSLPDHIIAIAGGKYNGNVVSINLITQKIEQITDFGNVPYNQGKWKLVGRDKVYFVEQVKGDYSADGLYEYDATTQKVRLVTKGMNVDKPVARFDIWKDKVSLDTRRGLYIADLAHNAFSELPQSKGYDLPSFSPDGEKLAMVRKYRTLVIRDIHKGGDTLLYEVKRR